MKLYLTLEHKNLKSTKIIEIKSRETAMVEDRLLQSMIDEIEQDKSAIWIK